MPRSWGKSTRKFGINRAENGQITIEKDDVSSVSLSSERSPFASVQRLSVNMDEQVPRGGLLYGTDGDARRKF